MENTEPSNSNKKKQPPQRNNSHNRHLSMSDTESTGSQADSWHSPLNYFDNTGNKTTKSLVAVDKYYSPGRPWPHSEKPTSDTPAAGGKGGRREENIDFTAKGDSPVVLGLNRLVREEGPAAGVKKVGFGGGGGGGGGNRLEEGYGGGGDEGEVGGERRSRAAVSSILRRSERGAAVSKSSLVFRVFEAVACLVSFSVMAADRTQGWSGDSFDRYKEYRYCLAVNVIGFAYSAFQALDLACYLGAEKHITSHHLRYHFDFSMDQILAYLLMSASSSAATRVDDWISNWGRDEFTLKASASIAMSFLAFLAFALSSLISGYSLCNRNSD